MTLKQTLARWLAGFVLVAQGATLALALRIAHTDATQAAYAALDVANAVAHSYLAERKQLLMISVSTLARDFALRSAIASGDIPTVESALRNHAARIHADTAMFLHPDGRLAATTTGEPFTIEPSLWNETMADRDRMIVLMGQDGTLYQMVVAPVAAPNLIGWVGMAFKLDVGVAAQLRSITGTEVAFADSHAGKTRVYAATSASILDDDQLRIAEQIDNLGIPTTLVLARSEDAALSSFRRLREFTLWLSIVAVALAISLSFGLAGRLTGNLAKLAAVAQRVRDGDYETALPEVRGKEVKELVGALGAMQRGIAEREGQIRHRALHDKLTELPNQELAITQLSEWLTAGEPIIAITMRVAGLQDLNSSLGIEMGDRAIRRLTDELHERDIDFIARLADTRFLLCLKSRNERRAEALAHQLHHQLRLLEVGPDIQVRLELHFGAAYGADGIDAEELVRNAWSASLEASGFHSGLTWYDADYRQRQERRLTIMRDLRGAVMDDHLTLVYQPKWAVREQRYSGVEALLRWTHPNLGFVPPDEFVGIAEQTQDIRLLTRWVLRHAIAQLQRWREQRHDFDMAVNISARDLTDAGLTDFIGALLHEHEIPGAALQLEVTEGALIHDLERSTETLIRLGRMGVRIAIDDYGTGFSSLSQLKNLPTHLLKIDKSFVMHLMEHESDQHIVESTIDLAHSLRMEVVAEGVEDEAALRLLSQWGCDVLQGFFLSKPVEAAEVARFLNVQRGYGADVVRITPT